MCSVEIIFFVYFLLIQFNNSPLIETDPVAPVSESTSGLLDKLDRFILFEVTVSFPASNNFILDATLLLAVSNSSFLAI